MAQYETSASFFDAVAREGQRASDGRKHVTGAVRPPHRPGAIDPTTYSQAHINTHQRAAERQQRIAARKDFKLHNGGLFGRGTAETDAFYDHPLARRRQRRAGWKVWLENLGLA